VTLDDFLGLYRLHRPGIASSTLDQYSRTLQHFQYFAGRLLSPADFSAALVLHYLQHRLEQVSPKTAKRERGELLALWRMAVQLGECSAVPSGIPPIKVPRRIPVSWRPEQVAAILSQCRQLRGEIRGTGILRGDWYTGLILFLYDTGARPGAALAVRPDQVDLVGRLAVLAGQDAKTGEEQVVEFSQQTTDVIERHWPQSVLAGCVWPQPYRREQPYRQLTRILRKAGLPADRYHKFGCFRRTNYTLCVRFGSRDIARRQLGHRTDLSAHYEDPRQLDTPQAVRLIPRPVADDQLRLF
jgi:integrase